MDDIQHAVCASCLSVAYSAGQGSAESRSNLRTAVKRVSVVLRRNQLDSSASSLSLRTGSNVCLTSGEHPVTARLSGREAQQGKYCPPSPLPAPPACGWLPFRSSRTDWPDSIEHWQALKQAQPIDRPHRFRHGTARLWESILCVPPPLFPLLILLAPRHCSTFLLPLAAASPTRSPHNPTRVASASISPSPPSSSSWANDGRLASCPGSHAHDRSEQDGQMPKPLAAPPADPSPDALSLVGRCRSSAVMWGGPAAAPSGR